MEGIHRGHAYYGMCVYSSVSGGGGLAIGSQVCSLHM